MSVTNLTAAGAATRYLSDLRASLEGVEATTESGLVLTLDDAAAQASAMIQEVRARGAKVLLVGNGGSAAIASHIHNDLSKAAGVRALVFNDVSLLTALANDIGQPVIFEKPVELWAEPRDLLIAVSSGGRSENILRAVEAARTRNCGVVTFSGFGADNPLRRRGHLNFYHPVARYGLVEVGHLALLHFLCDSVARG